MFKDKKVKKLIYWSFLGIFINAFLLELNKAKIELSASNFFIVIYISIGCLVALYIKTNWKKEVPVTPRLFFELFLVCNLIAFVRGMFSANGLEWKNILIDASGGLSLMIPLAMIAGVNMENGKRVLKLSINILAYSFLLVPLFINYTNEIYARLMTPVVFLILLIPYYKTKQKLIILIIGAVSAIIALTWRANVLHIGISLSLLSIYYFRQWITKSMLLFVQIILLIIPFYFLIQGINGKSVFAENQDQGVIINSKEGQEDFTADTRTGLYEEVLLDYYETQDIWLGRGSNGKYKTEQDWELEYGKEFERGNVEVGILKMLIQTGILGILLYAIIIWLAVYYGTMHTSNTLTKIIATYLASHWTMMFVENVIDYNMYFYFSWIAIGICLSNRLRSVSDAEIKEWLRYSR